MKKPKSKKITKKMLIGEIVEKYPELGRVLVEDYGFHCIGCFASGMESLEEGAAVHGLGPDELRVMVENLNELVESKGK